MSKMFVCGSFGCQMTEIDDEAASKAEADRIHWALAEKKKRGTFPSAAEQIEFITHAYQRHNTIRL